MVDIVGIGGDGHKIFQCERDRRYRRCRCGGALRSFGPLMKPTRTITPMCPCVAREPSIDLDFRLGGLAPIPPLPLHPNDPPFRT